jgi:hypothetical protein
MGNSILVFFHFPSYLTCPPFVVSSLFVVSVLSDLSLFCPVVPLLSGPGIARCSETTLDTKHLRTLRMVCSK